MSQLKGQTLPMSQLKDQTLQVLKISLLLVLPSKKGWKAKLESAYSFMLKYSKITVCLALR